jgi:hypothetical protein
VIATAVDCAISARARSRSGQRGSAASAACRYEVGFRHFAESRGFRVVLIVSGITLFAVAGGLVRLLPLLRRSG